ncbi:AAA family ATPase [Streptomyces sp. NPDC060048]|uniref:AAA family ATPase n=1 Tax=unclassified Streptomyces TaxID=2593676 RepID=UPI003686A257
MHVDRAEQLADAAHMISGAAAHRALFFEGQEGIGKTALLREMHRRHGENNVFYVDLGSSYAEFDVLNEIARQASGQGIRMDAFRALKQRYGDLPTVSFTNASVNRSHVDIALSVNANRDAQKSALSDELVATLNELAPEVRPVLLMDGFERCEPPMRDWISGSFLPDLLAGRRIAVFLAGQVVPTLRHPHAGVTRTLVLPLFDTRTVEEWIELAGIDALKGHADLVRTGTAGLPSVIKEFLSNFLPLEG